MLKNIMNIIEDKQLNFLLKKNYKQLKKVTIKKL